MTFNNKTHIFGSLWCLIATGLIEYSYTEKLYNIAKAYSDKLSLFGFSYHSINILYSSFEH